MARYSRLDLSVMLLPSLIAELGIIAAMAIGLTFSTLYVYASDYDIYGSTLHAHVLDPLSLWFLQHNMPNIPNRVATFLLLAVAGIIVHFIAYIVTNNYVLVREQAVYKNYSNWEPRHHWTRFFSAKASRFLLSILLLIGGVLLIHPLGTGAIRDVVSFLNHQPNLRGTVIRDFGVIFLTINGLVIAFKTLKLIRV